MHDIALSNHTKMVLRRELREKGCLTEEETEFLKAMTSRDLVALAIRHDLAHMLVSPSLEPQSPHGPDFDASDHPFTGALEYDLEVGMDGFSVRADLTLVYEYTPDWPFFDGVTTQEHFADQCLVLEAYLRPSGRGPRDPLHKEPKAVEEQHPAAYGTRLEGLIDGLGHEFMSDAQQTINGAALAEDAARQITMTTQDL